LGLKRQRLGQCSPQGQRYTDGWAGFGFIN
jgi:hypothetical protein